jgi:hypothetical protein
LLINSAVGFGGLTWDFAAVFEGLLCKLLILLRQEAMRLGRQAMENGPDAKLEAGATTKAMN